MLRGRGTTDFLGHVSLVTELMKRLGETKPALKSSVVAVFIASEVNSSIPGVGVDMLVKDKLLDKLKSGPFRVLETGGMIPWKLHFTGKLFHSGLAHKRDFPPHPQEKVYGFATPSTMKPTQWSYPVGGINQIPGECTISGDVRLSCGCEDEGFDVQTSGYGLMATYHAKNEYCLLTDMCQGFDVFVRIISQLEQD
ncbi:hypothetical protein N665_0545s0016 [Sinapis alba]|nr:hypothetical protein N665_0545s0016 [Sinapis alba]